MKVNVQVISLCVLVEQTTLDVVFAEYIDLNEFKIVQVIDFCSEWTK